MSGDETGGRAADERAANGSDERLELLALRTEAKRLGRAAKETRRVQFIVAGPDLWIGAVSNYNVVVDVAARRIQHGCRDFLSQGRAGMLCKHVAATLLAMEYDPAVAVLRGLTDADGPWRLEVISARGFGRKD